MEDSTTIRVTLPGPLKRFVDRRCKAKGHASPAETIRDLIRMARSRDETGDATEVSDEHWEAQRRALIERLRRHHEDQTRAGSGS